MNSGSKKLWELFPGLPDGECGGSRALFRIFITKYPYPYPYAYPDVSLVKVCLVMLFLTQVSLLSYHTKKYLLQWKALAES